MSLSARVAIGAFVLSLSVPAAAQYGVPPPDSQHQSARQRQAGQPAPQAPTTVGAADLSLGVACQLAADAASLEPMLATPPYSVREREDGARILRLIQRCQRSRGALTTSSALLRAAIAEALYESRFATVQAARSPEVPVASFLQVAAATTRPDAAGLVPAYAMAQCTAARHPEPIRALLATEPGTPAEAAALTALNPAFVSCVTGSLTLNMDMKTLRGVLAESLFRWSIAQRDGASSPYAAAAAGPAPGAF